MRQTVWRWAADAREPQAARKKLSKLCGSGTARGSVSTVGRTACTTFVRWLNRKSQAVGSSSWRSAAAGRAESDAGKGNGAARSRQPYQHPNARKTRRNPQKLPTHYPRGSRRPAQAESPEKPAMEMGQAEVTDPAEKPEKGLTAHPD